MVDTIDTDLSPVPSRTEPSTFSSRMDTWLGKISAWTTEANTLATGANTNKLAAEAAQSAAEAAQSAAETAETNAETAETNAEKWAEEIEDVEVETGKYSAKHWALKASVGDVFNATSTSSVTIGTGSKTFTLIETNRAYVVGSRVQIVNSSNTDDIMSGIVSAYSGTSLTVNITSSTGTGTASTWNIGLSIGGDADTLDGVHLSEITQVVKPSITSPTNGAVDFIGEIASSAYSVTDTYYGTHTHSNWQVSTSNIFSSLTDEYNGTSNLTTWTPSLGASPLTEFYVRVRHGSDNHWSQWSDVISYTTPNIYIETPSLTVQGSTTDEVPGRPLLETSVFSVFDGSDTHVSTDWRILDATGTTTIWESLADTSNKTSINIPSGNLEVSTAYQFKAKHNGATYGPSAWVTVTGTTKDDFRVAGDELSKITASDAQASDYFGYSVSISSDGTTAIVGAYWEDAGGTDAGAAYIFKYSGSAWDETKIVASDAQASDRFGVSVSISSDGTTAIVGAYYEDAGGADAGAAYIFKYNGSAWDTGTKIVASDAAASDYFGHSVSISSDGTTAIVGAYREDATAGAAYIFKYSGSAWDTGTKIVASDAEGGDYFGYSVSISSDGTTAIVGAYWEDAGGTTDAGAAYIFKYNESTSTWDETKITASDAAASDKFGVSVSISSDGTTAIVGAYLEDAGGSDAGAAYIFI